MFEVDKNGIGWLRVESGSVRPENSIAPNWTWIDQTETGEWVITRFKVSRLIAGPFKTLDEAKAAWLLIFGGW